MPRHHIVPQMLLKHFADDGGKLRATRRDDLSKSHATTYRNACRQAGYYRIEAEHIEEWARDGFDPEIVEKAYGEIESEAAPVINALAAGQALNNVDERRTLDTFIALQSTRGWSFQADLDDALTVHARTEMLTRRDELVTRARGYLAARGEPSLTPDAEAFVDRALGESGPTFVIDDATRIQTAVTQALTDTLPRLQERHLRIYHFAEPALLTSDSPVAYWAAGQGRAVGIGNAMLTVAPINRQVAVAYSGTASSRGSIMAGTALRAQQINLAVADDARRWIFEHPDDNLLPTLQVPTGRPQWKTEYVASRIDEQGLLRELWQHVRR